MGGNSLGTELFPTAIRGAMMGWYALIGAAAAITAQTLIAVLAGRIGGLSIVVGYLSLLAIPNAIIVALYFQKRAASRWKPPQWKKPSRNRTRWQRPRKIRSGTSRDAPLVFIP